MICNCVGDFCSCGKQTYSPLPAGYSAISRHNVHRLEDMDKLIAAINSLTLSIDLLRGK